MDSLTPDAAPVPSLPPEEFKLTLTITDSYGRVHELELTKVEGVVPNMHVFGDNIKLGSRLRMALDIVQRNSNLLF